MSVLKQIIFATPPLLNMVVLGMMFGYPALLTPALLDSSTDDVHADKDVATWIASLPGLSGLIGVFAAPPLMHFYGRKIAHLAITLPVTIGWILTSVASNIPMLIIGIALQGIHHGCIFFFAVCIAEFTNPHLRGLMLNLKFLSVTVGVLLIHIFGYFLHWRSLAIVGVVPCLISIAISLFWPETAEWLVSRHRFEEAEIVFASLRGDEASKREILKIIATEKARVELGKHQGSLKDMFKKIRSKVLWRPVALLFCALLIPELGGRHFFPTYSLQLSEKISGDKSMGFILTYIFDGISFVSAFISIFLIKNFSRRRQIIFSGVIIVALMLVFSLVMFLKVKFFQHSVILKWTAIVVLCIFFTVAFSSTYAVVYVLMGELFPLEYRSLGVFLNGLFCSPILTIALKVVPILNDALDLHGLFLILSLCILMAISYMFYDLPETKGRTLHDIAEYFRGKGNKEVTPESSKSYESETLNKV